MKILLPLLAAGLTACDRVSEGIPDIGLEEPKTKVLIRGYGDVSTGVAQIINTPDGLGYEYEIERGRGFETTRVIDFNNNEKLDPEELEMGEIIFPTEFGSEINSIPKGEWKGLQSGFDSLLGLARKN